MRKISVIELAAARTERTVPLLVERATAPAKMRRCQRRSSAVRPRPSSRQAPRQAPAQVLLDAAGQVAGMRVLFMGLVVSGWQRGWGGGEAPVLCNFGASRTKANSGLRPPAGFGETPLATVGKTRHQTRLAFGFDKNLELEPPCLLSGRQVSGLD